MTNKLKANSSDELNIPNLSVGIFLISVTGLLLEVLIIRWIGTEIRIFAYLQNTILIVCVLGLGLGTFTSNRPIRLQQSLVPLAILIGIMALPFTRQAFGSISELLSVSEEEVIWNSGRDIGIVSNNLMTNLFILLIGLIMTYCILILIVDMFVPLGQILGRLLREHENTIWAYSVNIGGSILGTWIFVLLSYFYQPPFTWFLVTATLIAVFIFWSKANQRLNCILLLLVVILSIPAGWVSDSIKTVWSPYQKLVVTKINSGLPDHYWITVNNTGYQHIVNLSHESVSKNAYLFPVNQQGLSQYDIPLLLHPNPKNFMIVGAGAGNDVAGALRNGALNITAVEIDPAIIEIGRELHPEKPYSFPNVKIINDDARSYFAITTDKYDVISFGLLDSHTTTAMTNARLDHYVYTKESIMQAASLLKPGGIISLTFEARRPYIADRIRTVLREVFRREPIVFRIPNNAYGFGGVMFITGDLDNVQKQLAANNALRSFIEDLQKTNPVTFAQNTKITTDDWPYIYLEKPKIPNLYFWISGLLLLIFVRSYKKWAVKSNDVFGPNRTFWHFFFLGAAFLLLEVQNISKASVILGNTWLVNTIIITSILTMALIANWLAYQFPKIPIKFVYAALIATTISLFFIDLARFAFLPYAIKAIITGGLTSLPVLFSGIVFIRSFDNVPEKDKALGANLIGALVGALLQSITFVTGIKALLLVVAGFYLLSYLTSSSYSSKSYSESIKANHA